MKHILPYLFFLLIAALAGCNKKEDATPHYDTIKPLPYLPVFPGSYWNYVNENGDTIQITTKDHYELNSYKSYNLYGSYTDSVYVPVWNTSFGRFSVYGYSTPKETASESISDEARRGLKQVPFLSETVGQSWGLYHDQYSSSSRVVANTDTTVTVAAGTYNKVIVVEDWGSSMGSPFAVRGRSYYAKDVGLIRKDTYYLNDSTLHFISLLNYYINN